MKNNDSKFNQKPVPLIGCAFTSLGFQSRRTSKYRGYIVVRRSAEEMRSMRYQMANTDTDNTPVFLKLLAYIHTRTRKLL